MKQRDQLEEMGEKLLHQSRTELYLAMRFMGPALMSLTPAMDLSTPTIGTDAACIRYNPLFVMQTYLEHPYVLSRIYLHTLLHCIFRHMYGLPSHPDGELWDLSCDIAAEAVIDDMDEELVRRTPSDFRTEWYSRLSGELHILTAEKLYRYFREHTPEYELLLKLSAEFKADDHVFWGQMKENAGGRDASGRPGEQDDRLAAAWKKAARRVQSELSGKAGRAGRDGGLLERLLSFDLKERLTWTDLLKRFAIYREEIRIDPDSFDPGFYHYGMELFGNMPLIEENEFAVSRRIRELVIAIDTSASCSDEMLRHFLSDVSAILFAKDQFFRRFQLHILECDAKVQRELLITSADEIKACADGISLKGGGGTDFRPVFSYVQEMQKAGHLRDLKGLLYFTDGLGLYPSSPPPCDTAFILTGDDLPGEKDIPGWILKVYPPGPKSQKNSSMKGPTHEH